MISHFPASMPSQIQHLAPGSPLLPMASLVAMYDVSPFQHSTEMSVQARWPHVPNAPLSSIPLSKPLQQQESVQTSQISHDPAGRTTVTVTSQHIHVTHHAVDTLQQSHSEITAASTQIMNKHGTYIVNLTK